MRLRRGDQISGVDGLQLRGYFRRFGGGYVNQATLMEEFSVARRRTEQILGDLVKLKMISKCGNQHDKKTGVLRDDNKGKCPGNGKSQQTSKTCFGRGSTSRILGSGKSG